MDRVRRYETMAHTTMIGLLEGLAGAAAPIEDRMWA